MRKKIFSLVLSFALVFTTVFAGAGSVFAGESAVKAYVPFNFNTADWTDEGLYLDKVVLFPDDLTAEPAEQTVKVSKKGHYVFMVTAAATGGGRLTACLFDAEGESVYQAPIELAYDEGTCVHIGTANFELGLEKTGTYTVAVIPEEDFMGEMMCELFVSYLPQSTKASPVSIVNGGEKMYDNPSNGYSWFKVKTTGQRNLKIQFSEEGTFNVRLYKQNKKTVLGGGTVSVGKGKKYTTYYAVPAGTYYVRVYKKEAVTPYYGIKMSTSKVTEKSGATKTKAVSFGKNVLKKGTLLATETAASSVDWYKVTIKKKQNFWMHLTFKTGGISKGGVKISVYKKGSSKVQLSKKFASGAYSQDWKLFTKGNNGKLAPGTYYFKVQKYNYGTGYYALKWNNVE